MAGSASRLTEKVRWAMIAPALMLKVAAHANADEVAEAAREAGMRAVVAETIIDGETPTGRSPQQALAETERLLAEAHVAVVPGEAFGVDRHIRISYAASMKDLERGLDRIHQFIVKNS